MEKTAANYNSPLEILKDSYGDEHRIMDTHYKKLINLDLKTEVNTHLKQLFDNLELHIRVLEDQNKKKEEFGDLLTLFLMDKLSRDLRRCFELSMPDDFPTAFKRELQVIEKDKPKEVNSMTKLNCHSTADFYTSQTEHKIQKHNTELQKERKTTQDRRNQPQSIVSVDPLIEPATT